MSRKISISGATNNLTLNGVSQSPCYYQMSITDAVRNMKKRAVDQKKLIISDHSFVIPDSSDEEGEIANSQESEMEVRPLKFSFRTLTNADTREDANKVSVINASTPIKLEPKEMMKVNKPVTDKNNIFTSTQAGLSCEDARLFQSSSERAYSPVTPRGSQASNNSDAHSDVTIEYYNPCLPCGSSITSASAVSETSPKTINLQSEVLPPNTNTNNILNVTPPRSTSTSDVRETSTTSNNLQHEVLVPGSNSINVSNVTPPRGTSRSELMQIPPSTINVLNQTIVPPSTSNTLNVNPPRGMVILGLTLQLAPSDVNSKSQADVSSRENCDKSSFSSGKKRSCQTDEREQHDFAKKHRSEQDISRPNNEKENGTSTSGIKSSTSLFVATGKDTSNCGTGKSDKKSSASVKRALFQGGSDVGKDKVEGVTLHRKSTDKRSSEDAEKKKETDDIPGPSGVRRRKECTTIERSNSSETTKERSNSSETLTKTPEKSTRNKQVNTPKKTSSPSTSKSPRKRLGAALKASGIVSPKKYKSEKEERKPNIELVKILIKLVVEVYKNVHLKNLLIEEKDIFKKFTDLNQNGKYVVLKLFTFKRKWYNVSKFCERLYLDLSGEEVIDLYHRLKDIDFIETDSSMESLSLTLYLLDRSKLKDICKTLNATPKVKSKVCMVQALLKICNQQSTLTATSFRDILKKQIAKHMGHSMKLKDAVHDAFYRAFSLATFTNSQLASPSDYFFLAQKMLEKVTVFPEYPIEDYVVFSCRDSCLSYLKAKRLKEEFNETDQKKYFEIFQLCSLAFRELNLIQKDNDTTNEDIHKDVPHLRRYTAQRVYITIISNAAQRLTTKYPEEVKEWLQYLIETYPTSRRISEWYSQLAWLHMRYLKPTNYETAAELLIEVLQERRDNICERSLYEMIDRSRMLMKGKNKVCQLYQEQLIDFLPTPISEEDFSQNQIDAQTIRGNESSRRRDYVITDEDGNKTFKKVEGIALEHYKENGYTDGCHCEGSTIKAMFVLYFWDIIYNPEQVVPGTFLSRIQNAPLDMFSEYFYLNRQGLIEKRLLQISSEWSEEEFFDFAMSKWELHSHKYSVYGEIRRDLPRTTLETLIRCINRTVLAKIFERLVKNVGRISSGMPDLVIWNSEQETVKFVEVKGEGDKLSTTQKLWLKYLQDIGADAEVCYVHSIGSKRKKINKAGKSNLDDENV